MAHILIVEDDPAIRKMTASVLRHAGHQVALADNGEAAVDYTLNRNPDLIVTDIMMPRMDGWQLVKRLRAQRNTAFTPILFLSQLDGYEDRVRGFRLGADDYITKPFAPRDLVARVERMLDPDAVFAETAGMVRGGPDLEGSLERIGISAVLMMLEAERKTGILTLAVGGETARVWVREGAAVRAEVTQKPELKADEAVYHALNWTTGTFDFIECEVSGDDEIETELTYLLIEGARRIDESGDD